jgi:hypothetical protein
MRRSGQAWKGCVPPPQMAMLLRAHCSTSASRMTSRSSAIASTAERGAVLISIMLSVISSFTSP